MLSPAQRKALFHLPDIYVVSYPKSGRTWLKVLLGKWMCLQYNQPEEFILHSSQLSARCGLPIIAFNHNGSQMEAKKSHQELRPGKSSFKDKKVILLRRDIKDTLVSAYFQAVKRDGLFQGPISEFIRSPLFGVQKILAFYRHWDNNVNTPKDFLQIRYEEMHENPARVLIKVLRFIGIEGIEEINAHAVDEAVEYASFNNMRTLEAKRRFNTHALLPQNPDDPESFKVRQGKTGAYGQYLSKEDIDYIDGMERQWSRK